MRVLITSYYSEPNILRKKELDYVLANNIMNRMIDKIVLVCDDTVPDHVNFDFDKVVMVRWDKRPTFADVFYSIAPKHTTDEDVKIFSNADIYFDDTLRYVDHIQWDKKIALCLSRWDKKNDEWVVYPSWDAQDVWIVKGEIPPMFCSFPMGVPGCDNRLMHELDKAGYWVFNPAKDIKCYHVHDSQIRSYDASIGSPERVPAPYKLMHPHDLSTIKLYTPKKIFHIGLYSFFSERAIGDSLADIGEYKFLDWQTFTKGDWKIEPSRKEEFEKIVLENTRWADIVFCQLQTPDIITKELGRRMKTANPNAKLVNWTGDVRQEIPKDILDIAPYFHTLFTNDTDVQKMRELGFESDYLQIGYSHLIYNPKGAVSKCEDIVFMGNNYWDKEKGYLFPNGEARYNMVKFLKKEYGDKFGVYGNGWNTEEMKELNIWASGSFNHDAIKEASLYRGCKVAINYSHFDYSRYSSDRVLRIMGSGAFCLTHKFPDMEKDYEIGKHLAIFENFDQLKTSIDYFLENEKERKQIAKEGCEFVHKYCTWSVRMKQLLK